MASRGIALADRILTYFGDRQPGFGRGIELTNGAQFAEIGIEDIADLVAALLELEEAGLMKFAVGVNNGRADLQQGYMRSMLLTLTGWDRHERLKRANPESTTAFMAMQFGDGQMNRIYNDHFRPALREIGLDLHTVADRPNAGLIDYQIRLQVTASRIVIADLSHQNRGVYFEAGFADGIGRPVIYTCRADLFDPELGRPHFDVNHHTCVRWSDPPLVQEIGDLQLTIQNSLALQARTAPHG